MFSKLLSHKTVYELFVLVGVKGTTVMFPFIWTWSVSLMPLNSRSVYRTSVFSITKKWKTCLFTINLFILSFMTYVEVIASKHVYTEQRKRKSHQFLSQEYFILFQINNNRKRRKRKKMSSQLYWLVFT